MKETYIKGPCDAIRQPLQRFGIEATAFQYLDTACVWVLVGMQPDDAEFVRQLVRTTLDERPYIAAQMTPSSRHMLTNEFVKEISSARIRKANVSWLLKRADAQLLSIPLISAIYSTRITVLDIISKLHRKGVAAQINGNAWCSSESFEFEGLKYARLRSVLFTLQKQKKLEHVSRDLVVQIEDIMLGPQGDSEWKLLLQMRQLYEFKHLLSSIDQ
jgi:hypothetical protein